MVASSNNKNNSPGLESFRQEVEELRFLLHQETDKREKVEEEYELLKRGFQSKLDEARTAQISLNDNLLETTVLIERMYEKFARTVADLEEGILAKFCEFQKTPAGESASDSQVNTQMQVLDRLNEVFEKLDGSREQIGEAVRELKRTVNQRTCQTEVSENVYKSIFRRVKDGIFIVDSNWNITDANPAMCEMLGYKYRRLAIGRNIHNEVFADEYDFEVFEKDVILSGFIRNYETKFRRDRGGEIDVVLSCTSIWGEGDVLVGYEGVARDITEQKKLQKQRMDMQRLEAVNNMVITINHNMNQNLTVIYNYLQIISEKLKGDTTLEKYLNTMRSEVEGLIEVVRKITKIKDIQTIEYVDGVQMIDLEKSIRGD